MERDGRTIAHVGLWPVKVRTDAKSERGVHAMDWAADPQARGAGVSLFMSLTKSYDFVYGMGGSEMTRSILPKLGFRTVAEALTWHAHSVRGGKCSSTRARIYASRCASREISVVEETSKTVPRGWAAVKPGAGSARGLSERDESFFRYLQKCPVAPCLTFHIANEGRFVGFFALCVVGEQARVAGVWLENPSSDIWRIAFHLAQEAALRHTNTSELIARCTTGPSAIAAEQTGMRSANGRQSFSSARTVALNL